MKQRKHKYSLVNEVDDYMQNVKGELFDAYDERYTGTIISNRNAELMNQIIRQTSDFLDCSVIVYKNKSIKLVENSQAWEFENDKDWFITINLSKLS